MLNRSRSSLVNSAVCALLVLTAVVLVSAQAKRSVSKSGAKSQASKASVPLIKVTEIDIEGLRKIIKPNTKPLMINFWATWCGPCREEFPDLVKVNNQYKGKIDFLTVSLDDLADIETAVPKFLSQMNADMPAYLLRTPDESAAIALVSSDWAGNLPLTIIYKPDGQVAYLRKGPIRVNDVSTALDQLLSPAAPAQ